MLKLFFPSPKKYEIAISRTLESERTVIYRTRHNPSYKIVSVLCRVLYFDEMYLWFKGGSK